MSTKSRDMSLLHEGARRAREAGIKPQTMRERAGLNFAAARMQSNAKSVYYISIGDKPWVGLVAAQEVLMKAFLKESRDDDKHIRLPGLLRTCNLQPEYRELFRECLPAYDGLMDTDTYKEISDIRRRRQESHRGSGEGKSVAERKQKKKGSSSKEAEE